jgi:hypothetical protein
MSNLGNRQACLILVVLSFLGFIFPMRAQLVTNQSARFKTKVVLFEGKEGVGVSSTTISPSPEGTAPNNEVSDAGTSSGREYELKWKYLGRQGDKDCYHFTFTRMTKAGVSGKTTTFKDVLFNGHRATIFEDDLHTVVIDAPSDKDLKK